MRERQTGEVVPLSRSDLHNMRVYLQRARENGFEIVKIAGRMGKPGKAFERTGAEIIGAASAEIKRIEEMQV